MPINSINGYYLSFNQWVLSISMKLILRIFCAISYRFGDGTFYNIDLEIVGQDRRVEKRDLHHSIANCRIYIDEFPSEC